MESPSPFISVAPDLVQLAAQIKIWGAEMGFQQLAITDCEVGAHKEWLNQWLGAGHAGEMDYMDRHRHLRQQPDELVPGAIRAICVRLDYLPEGIAPGHLLRQKDRAYISRYALGRDYHKLIRGRLAKLATKIEQEAGGTHRAFVDSAPVLERAFAEKSGMGWIGKNTMLINRRAGSWFFLGEIYTTLALPIDPPEDGQHCGSCRACLDICPTQAFTGPWQLDARKCISYLTIELKGAIPEHLRPMMGNRVFGCDDCQLICPWNKFASHTKEQDFQPRHNLDDRELVDLFEWTEEEFLSRTAGSPIRRIGHQRWRRNLAVGLGNAPYDIAIIKTLTSALADASELEAEHFQWAIDQQESKAS
ncbi:MAG: tRNA epoxyqueuosine(34) reductase QueG [Pseudomonadales bacterium]